MKKATLNKLVKSSILTSIAFLLMYFEFPIGFPIMKFDFSDIPALIGAFALGPVWGIGIELIKNLMICLLKGSDTAYVGQFANFLVGSAFVYPAALVYKYNKTKKGACLGMAAGTLSIILIVSLANYYILFPFYINAMHLPLEKIIEMANSPMINSKLTYVIYLVIPFNLIKAAVVTIFTLLLYKPLSYILHK